MGCFEALAACSILKILSRKVRYISRKGAISNWLRISIEFFEYLVIMLT